MNKIRVLIIEDEPLIAQDLSLILEGNDYHVSAIIHKAENAFTELKHNTPDIALLDINLEGDIDGVHIGAHILEKYNFPIVYITAYADKKTVERAKYTRPMGYIVKPFDERDIFTTIEIALYNYANIWKPLKFDRAVLNQKIMNPITQKEFEILIDIYEGKTNHQLADKHFVSMNTVKTHIRHLYHKMNVGSRAEVIVNARKILGQS